MCSKQVVYVLFSLIEWIINFGKDLLKSKTVFIYKETFCVLCYCVMITLWCSAPVQLYPKSAISVSPWQQEMGQPTLGPSHGLSHWVVASGQWPHPNMLVWIRAANEPSAKFSQSQRKPLLGPSPGWKCPLALSDLRHYAKWALTAESRCDIWKVLVGAFSVIVKSSRTFVWSSNEHPV